MNTYYYVVNQEHELYSDYNEALIAAIPECTHHTGVQPVIKLAELDVDDYGYEDAAERAGIALLDDNGDELEHAQLPLIHAIMECNQYKGGWSIYSASTDEDDVKKEFYSVVERRYSDSLFSVEMNEIQETLLQNVGKFCDIPTADGEFSGIIKQADRTLF